MRSNEKFTRRSEDAIEKARQAAGELGHGFVGTGHLLLGILREEDSLGSRVLRRRGLREEALLAELASPPGGFDALLAKNIGLRVLEAPGLPGKSAPHAAAMLLLKTVEQIMEEE